MSSLLQPQHAVNCQCPPPAAAAALGTSEAPPLLRPALGRRRATGAPIAAKPLLPTPCCYAQCRTPPPPCRNLSYYRHVQDPHNPELRAHVLRGDIDPAAFVRMTATELASKARLLFTRGRPRAARCPRMAPRRCARSCCAPRARAGGLDPHSAAAAHSHGSPRPPLQELAAYRKAKEEEALKMSVLDAEAAARFSTAAALDARDRLAIPASGARGRWGVGGIGGWGGWRPLAADLCFSGRECDVCRPRLARMQSLCCWVGR